MASFMLLGKKLDESVSVSTEGEIEIALIKSMEETKKENEKINELMEEIPQEVNDKGYGQIGLSYSSFDRMFTVQAKNEDFIKRNKRIVENIIVNIADELLIEKKY